MINFRGLGIGRDADFVGQNSLNEDGQLHSILNAKEDENLIALNNRFEGLSEGSKDLSQSKRVEVGQSVHYESQNLGLEKDQALIKKGEPFVTSALLDTGIAVQFDHRISSFNTQLDSFVVGAGSSDFGPSTASDTIIPNSLSLQSKSSVQRSGQISAPTGSQNSSSGFTPKSYITVRRRGRVKHKGQPASANSAISGGSMLCCESTHSSDVLCGNARFWRNYEVSKVEKIWVQAQSLGVQGSEADEVYVSEIRVLEERDEEALRLKEKSGGQL